MTSSFYRPPIKDITITSSIGRKSSSLYYGQITPYQSTDFESFPIEVISSSTAGVFPDLHGNVSSSNYYINITQSWSSSILGPLGYGVFVNDDQKEFYNGELSGSNLTISDQRLIDENCVQFLEVDTIGSSYTSKFFYGNSYLGYPPYVFYEELYSIMTINEFMNENVAPHPGEIFLYYSQDTYRNVVEQTPIVDPSGKVVMGEGILFVKINRVDNSGSNNTLSLQSLQQIRIKFKDVYGTGVPLSPTSPFKYDYTTYDVLSISEYPNYYLYLINSKNRMSITSNKIGSYSVTATTTTGSIVPFDGIAFVNFTYSSSVSGVGASYFNSSSTSFYTFGDTPNIGFDVTASVTLTGSNVAISLDLYDSNGNGIRSISSPYSFTTSLRTITVSGSFSRSTYSSSVVEGMYFKLGVDNPGGAKAYYSASFILNQLVAPSSSATSVTVFNPTLTTAFTNTDCDITMNNAIEDRASLIYQQIDYNTSTTVPVNYQAIVSRSANYAQVNDFNYYSTPRALAKYKGAKVTSFKINKYFNFDISPDKTPNVQLLENYFLYFDWIGGTTPEFTGKTAAHIKALIDIDGNIYEPSDVGLYFDNYVRTFSKGAYANVIIRAADNSYPSSGLKNILYPYNFPVPVIASQTGSQLSETVSLTSIAFYKYPEYYNSVITYFDNNNISSFNSLWTGSSTSSFNNNPNYYAIPTSYSQLSINGSTYANNSSISGSNNIKFTATTNKTKVKLTAKLYDVVLSNYYNNGPNDKYDPTNAYHINAKNSTIVTFNVRIYEFPTGSFWYKNDTTTKILAQKDFSIYGKNQNNFDSGSVIATIIDPNQNKYILETDWINIDTSKAYSVAFKMISIQGPDTLIYIENNFDPLGITTNSAAVKLLREMGVKIPNPQLEITQQTGPTSGVYTTASYNPGNSLYYWTTGSDKTILNGPQFTANIYKSTDVGALFQSWSPSGSEKNAGYGDYVPFQIYPGDQIRFEGDESQVYNIIESFPPGNTSAGNNPYLQLKLDRPIIDGTQINSFLVRRLGVNPSFMVLDWDGTGYTGGGGFIIPQYMAKRGAGIDYNKIITSLKEKGIIPVQ